AAHDQRQAADRFVVDVVLLDDRVERTFLATISAAIAACGLNVDNVSNAIYICNICIIRNEGHEKLYIWPEKRCFVGRPNPRHLRLQGHSISGPLTNEES